MLIVLTIILTLFAIAARGAKKTWEGQEIRASAMKLSADLTLASQSAVKLNRTVQVRFLQYHDMNVAVESPQFHAYQLVVSVDGGLTTQWRALYEVQKLEGSTIISSAPKFSTLVERPQQLNPQQDSRLMRAYMEMPNLKYTSIEFRPDGSTNLDPDANTPWMLTLVPVRYATELNEMPNDFSTLIISPDTGAVRVY
jgi:uncharacterized protein (TIGR02596 family)